MDYVVLLYGLGFNVILFITDIYACNKLTLRRAKN